MARYLAHYIIYAGAQTRTQRDHGFLIALSAHLTTCKYIIIIHIETCCATRKLNVVNESEMIVYVQPIPDHNVNQFEFATPLWHVFCQIAAQACK